MAWDWDKLQRKRSGPSPHPPDMDEVVERIRRYRNKIPGVPVIIGILLIFWLLSGIYIVAPDEIGVVKRFGSMVYTTTPGPHYHLPYPIETVIKPPVTKVRRVEIGFRTIAEGPPSRYQAVPDESLMLTGDENIVDIQFIVQYRIKDAAAYLFNVMGPDSTVKDAAEAAMRQVVGRSKIDEALTTGKLKLQQDTKQLLQNILDNYEAGIAIDAVQLQDVHPPQEVIQAFKDVASAKEDKVKYINDSQGYANDILPKANGRAAEIVNEALAYQQTKINYAQGDANRFLQTLTEYLNAKEITKKRMYLETMEEVLERAQKVIVSEKAGNLFPLLPLKGFQTSKQQGEESGKEEK
jgi:membrane protease subunit HflK